MEKIKDIISEAKEQRKKNFRYIFIIIIAIISINVYLTDVNDEPFHIEEVTVLISEKKDIKIPKEMLDEWRTNVEHQKLLNWAYKTKNNAKLSELQMQEKINFPLIFIFSIINLPFIIIISLLSVNIIRYNRTIDEYNYKLYVNEKSDKIREIIDKSEKIKEKYNTKSFDYAKELLGKNKEINLLNENKENKEIVNNIINLINKNEEDKKIYEELIKTEINLLKEDIVKKVYD